MAFNTASDKKEAVKAYKKGESIEELALKYEVSTRTIYRWIAKHNSEVTERIVYKWVDDYNSEVTNGC